MYSIDMECTIPIERERERERKGEREREKRIEKIISRENDVG